MKKKRKPQKTLKSALKVSKRTLALVVLGLCLVSLVAVTLAVEKAYDWRLNTMEIAETKVAINEYGFKNNDPANVPKPGSTIQKRVTVDNQGETPIFVRAQIIPLFGKSQTATNDRSDKLKTNILLPLVMRIAAASDGTEDVLLLGQSADWVQSEKDGYFYYLKVLNEEGVSGDLFSSIQLPLNNCRYLDEYTKDFYFNVEVKVEAVTIYEKKSQAAYQTAWNRSEMTGDLGENDTKIQKFLTTESK